MIPPVTLILSREPALSAGVRWFLLEQLQVPRCLEAATHNEAQALAVAHSPHLIMVVSALMSEDTPRLVQEFHRDHQAARIVVMGRNGNPDSVKRSLNAGAMAFVTALDSFEELRLAVESAMCGSIHVSASASRGFQVDVSRRHISGLEADIRALSNRELEVFDLIAEGLGVKLIAGRLGISAKTVETHKQRLKEKLHLNTCAELARTAVTYALSKGLSTRELTAG